MSKKDIDLYWIQTSGTGADDRSVIEIRDDAIAVLSSMGLKWNQHPLLPQHDMPIHSNGDDISEEEYEELMKNPKFNNAVWDLVNIWSLSDERRNQQ